MQTMNKKLEAHQQYYTRGEYGVLVDELTLIGFDPETQLWTPNENGSAWGAFDPDWGWMPNFNIEVK
jgi:hypothetical protein